MATNFKIALQRLLLPRQIARMPAQSQAFKLKTAQNPHRNVMGSSPASRAPAELPLGSNKVVTIEDVAVWHAREKIEKIVLKLVLMMKMREYAMFDKPGLPSYKKVSTVGAHASKENELQFFSGKNGNQAAHLIPRIYLVNGLPLWSYVPRERVMIGLQARGISAAVTVADACINRADSLMEQKGFAEDLGSLLMERLLNDPRFRSDGFDINRMMEFVEQIGPVSQPSIIRAIEHCTEKQGQEKFAIRKEVLSVYYEEFENHLKQNDLSRTIMNFSETFDSEVRE